VKRTRIVLAGVPKMMDALIEAIVTAHSDLRVVARMPANGDVRAALRHHRADVLIVMERDGASTVDTERWFCRRPSKVLAITEGGREGRLYMLRPHDTALGELSAERLIDAIRSAGDA
jgi:hypothetical protein